MILFTEVPHILLGKLFFQAIIFGISLNLMVPILANESLLSVALVLLSDSFPLVYLAQALRASYAVTA